MRISFENLKQNQNVKCLLLIFHPFRCQSPSNHRSKPHATTANIGTASSSPKPKATRDEMSELNYHVRQVKHALQHFRDVISKSKFEVLPGNGTVLLESIANVNNILQSPTLNVNRNSVTSAKTQLYLSLGKLIKLSDEVLTKDDDAYSASLSTENVIEIIDSVDIAIQVNILLFREVVVMQR